MFPFTYRGIKIFTYIFRLRGKERKISEKGFGGNLCHGWKQAPIQNPIKDKHFSKNIIRLNFREEFVENAMKSVFISNMLCGTDDPHT